MDIRVKRVYDEPEAGDGLRVLVDRYWPRGLSRDNARVDLWLRDISPSDELRRSFAHDAKRWERFRSEYTKQLDNRKELVARLLSDAKKGPVTLLYSSKEERYNNAVALMEYLKSFKVRMRSGAAA